jgi:hypothetical protein
VNDNFIASPIRRTYMKRTNHVSIPAPIMRLQKQWNEFRASHRRRTKLRPGDSGH